jgi:hypothetical protein
MEFWVPEVSVGAVHELVGNALIMKGEKPDRTDLRGQPFVGHEEPEPEKVEEVKNV